MAAATMQIEALDQNQLRQAMNTMYKPQKQVEKAIALLEYEDL
jgi:hypothetical protein